MTRVEAPSRLHFGLLNLPAEGRERWPGLDGQPGLPVRHFGGVGLMVDTPGLAVYVERANEWSASGPLAERALEFATRFVATLPTESRSPFRVVVERCAEQHVGLGVGTQLALAVARAMAIEASHADWNAIELATRVGRGERSAIGVHGFDRGGLIVEGGKLPGEAISPCISQMALPTNWTTVLFHPQSETCWHGTREQRAFDRLVGPSISETDALCRLVLTSILPGIVSEDIELVGEAVHEFNARVGEIFSPVQGGRYASPQVSECVSRLRKLGVKGVGQSSWGTTVFAIVQAGQASEVMAAIPDVPSTRGHISSGHRWSS